MRRTPEEGYASLASGEQVDLLREVARTGAGHFGLEVRGIELVRHEFNTTFRVDGSDGHRFAVRVNTNSFSSPEHIRAQHAWMRALAAETSLRLPVPLRTVAGADHTMVPTRHGEFVVVAASWLDGEDVGECDPIQARAMGRAMAAMHAHAERWALPPGGRLSSFTDPFFGDDDRLSHAFPADSREADLVRWSLRRCRDAILTAERDCPPVVVHGDLHGGNLKWHRDELAVFDFDDCGIASPALDLAIATFYLRGSAPRVEERLRGGYGDVRSLPDVAPAVFEALVASRQLLLANDLLLSTTEHLRAQARGYLDRTVDRLGHWRETGHFSLTPGTDRGR
ncbi:phosphotransferase enzyme family protein [Nostocoides sp. F2B08]|uniref:phosphotransferase enzyme family protein n=1 Tax=Nostocoides sp. F2B08 TaxID=2653936 RepID=UPI00186AF3C4|nr:phosphotransferase [Tetrasphaera sp. F2B08]